MAVKTETTFGTLYFDQMEHRNEASSTIVLVRFTLRLYRTRSSDRNRLWFGEVH